MGRLRIWLIVTVGLVLLAPVGAAAYTYTQILQDDTLVLPYKGASHTTDYASGGPVDVIANNTALWDIKQVAIIWDTVNSTLEMKIYTNYAPGGQEGAGQGDIVLSPGGDGKWGYGIILSGVNSLGDIKTSLVPVTTWLATTQTSWATNGSIYSGAYGASLPIESVINVHGASLATVNGSYTQLGGSDISTYLIDLVFSYKDLELDFDHFDFMVKSGTCGNDTMVATATLGDSPVPLPPSALLLGTGLVGLVGLGWRRRRQSS
jgi:hypothetical protein